MNLIGEFLIFCGHTLRAMFRRPWQVREFIEQAWFISSVSILPAALVSIPFGAVIALQLGSLVRQLGAQLSRGALPPWGRGFGGQTRGVRQQLGDCQGACLGTREMLVKNVGKVERAFIAKPHHEHRDKGLRQ